MRYLRRLSPLARSYLDSRRKTLPSLLDSKLPKLTSAGDSKSIGACKGKSLQVFASNAIGLIGMKAKKAKKVCDGHFFFDVRSDKTFLEKKTRWKSPRLANVYIDTLLATAQTANTGTWVRSHALVAGWSAASSSAATITEYRAKNVARTASIVFRCCSMIGSMPRISRGSSPPPLRPLY